MFCFLFLKLFLEPILAVDEAGDDERDNIVAGGVDHRCGRIDQVAEGQRERECDRQMIREEDRAEHELARTATTIASSARPVVKSWPNMPNRNATLMMADIAEPSMCIVAPSGTTMFETSLGMPVSSATSMFVGIVATEEHVPKLIAAGRNSFENMTFAAPLPPPKRA